MKSKWTVGRVLPCLMLIVVGIEVTLVLVPFNVFADRPSEALGLTHPLDGPFAANAQYHNPQSFGDLAALGNLPERRLYRRVDFTTDSFGFHNSPSITNLPWTGILFGDSFAIGAEVPQDKTLSIQLSTLFGGRIYNAGAYFPMNIERVHQLANRLKLHAGIFIYEFHEAHLKEIPPLNASASLSWRHKLAVRILGPLGAVRLKGELFSLCEFRFRPLAQKFVRSLENEAHLPNSFAGTVIEGQLQNGDWMLFLRSRTEPVDHPEAAIKRWGDFFSLLSSELNRDKLELVVVMIPDSSTVYGPLLTSPVFLRRVRFSLASSKIFYAMKASP